MELHYNLHTVSLYRVWPGQTLYRETVCIVQFHSSTIKQMTIQTENKQPVRNTRLISAPEDGRTDGPKEDSSSTCDHVYGITDDEQRRRIDDRRTVTVKTAADGRWTLAAPLSLLKSGVAFGPVRPRAPHSINYGSNTPPATALQAGLDVAVNAVNSR